MKRGRKKGGRMVNGRYVVTKAYREKVAPEPSKETTDLMSAWIKEFERSEKIKVIDHIRNVILPYLEGKI